MTYEEFKKKMMKLSEARKDAMEDNDFDADEEFERAMLQLEKENFQYVNEWVKDVWVSMKMNKFGQNGVMLGRQIQVFVQFSFSVVVIHLQR